MKRFTTIFVLVLLVSIQTPLGQLFKLPTLIEHFIKHQQQAGVSFLGFLQDHYAQNHNDADLPEDEQLPFKNIAFNTIGNAVVAGVIMTTVLVSLPADKKVIFHEAYAAQQHSGSIFHPPRI